MIKKVLKILDKTSTIFDSVKRIQSVPIFIGNYVIGADERKRTVIIKQKHFFLSRRKSVFQCLSSFSFCLLFLYTDFLTPLSSRLVHTCLQVAYATRYFKFGLLDNPTHVYEILFRITYWPTTTHTHTHTHARTLR